MKRRTMIRLLVAIGIGIPLLVEGITFFGLFEAQLFGNGDDVGTPSWTPAEGAVGVGDEFLFETNQTETLSTATIATEEDTRLVTLTVLVENPTNESYELRLDSLTTDGGQTLNGGESTGIVPPGQTGVVTQEWTLSNTAYPRSVSVVAIIHPDGETRRVAASIPLERIPIRE